MAAGDGTDVAGLSAQARADRVSTPISTSCCSNATRTRSEPTSQGWMSSLPVGYEHRILGYRSMRRLRGQQDAVQASWERRGVAGSTFDSVAGTIITRNNTQYVTRHDAY